MRTLMSLLIAAALAGCARTVDNPTAADHPASPQAQEATPVEVAIVLKPGAGDTVSPPGREPAAHDHAASDRETGGHPAHDHSSPAAKPSAAATAGDATAVYTCAHHPEVRSDQPGNCPKCAMSLTPPKPPADQAPASAAHDHADHASAAKPNAVYTCPHHPEVKSDQPGKCPKCAMSLKPAATQPSTKPAPKPAGHGHGSHGGGL